MTNSLVLSKKVKVKLGVKANRNGNRAWVAKKSFQRPTLLHEKVEVKTLELKGLIYDTGHILQADMYMQTTKEIAQYVGQTYKQVEGIKQAIKKLEEMFIPKPTLSTIQDKVKEADGKVNSAIANIYTTKEIKMHLK
eukprot:4574370-Ditylum_brightwellii.AAC.1